MKMFVKFHAEWCFKTGSTSWRWLRSNQDITWVKCYNTKYPNQALEIGYFKHNVWFLYNKKVKQIYLTTFVSFFNENDNWWTINVYNNIECKKIRASEMSINWSKDRYLSKESYAVYIVLLRGSPMLWAPSKEPNDWLEQLLYPIRPTESNNHLILSIQN